MPEFFTEITDGEMGRSAAVNTRLQEIENAILERDGLMRARTPWTTLAASQSSITIDVATGDNTLQLFAHLKTNYAVANMDDVLITFNDDTSSTYTVRYAKVESGVGGTVADASGTTGFPLYQAAYGNQLGQTGYGFLKFTIPQASDAVTKVCPYDTLLPFNYSIFCYGGAVYPVATTITRIRLFPVNGTAFVAGCRYALFGVN